MPDEDVLQVTLRLPRSQVERLDKLISDRSKSGVKSDRQTMLRHFVDRGLYEAERKRKDD